MADPNSQSPIHRRACEACRRRCLARWMIWRPPATQEKRRHSAWRRWRPRSGKSLRASRAAIPPPSTASPELWRCASLWREKATLNLALISSLEKTEGTVCTKITIFFSDHLPYLSRSSCETRTKTGRSSLSRTKSRADLHRCCAE